MNLLRSIWQMFVHGAAEFAHGLLGRRGVQRVAGGDGRLKLLGDGHCGNDDRMSGDELFHKVIIGLRQRFQWRGHDVVIGLGRRMASLNWAVIFFSLVLSAPAQVLVWDASTNAAGYGIFQSYDRPLLAPYIGRIQVANVTDTSWQPEESGTYCINAYSATGQVTDFSDWVDVALFPGTGEVYQLFVVLKRSRETNGPWRAEPPIFLCNITNRCAREFWTFDKLLIER